MNLTKMNLTLWIRKGEAGEYSRAESVEEAIRLAQEAGFLGRFACWQRFGFETDVLRGRDYVSLYWGEPDGTPVRYLTREEKRRIEELL